MVPTSVDPVRPLELTHVPSDPNHFDGGHVRLRRHVAESPVMRAHPTSNGEFECDVRVVRRLVGRMNERRSGRAAGCVPTMASGAGAIERLSSYLSVHRQLRNAHCFGRWLGLPPPEHQDCYWDSAAQQQDDPTRSLHLTGAISGTSHPVAASAGHAVRGQAARAAHAPARP
jgi:hypothetical protein